MSSVQSVLISFFLHAFRKGEVTQIYWVTSCTTTLHGSKLAIAFMAFDMGKFSIQNIGL